MTRRRKLLIASTITLPILGYLAWAGYVRVSNEWVQTGTMVGRTEEQIRGSYGQPDTDWQGYHSLARHKPPELPPGPIRTLIFCPRGLLHPEGGTLWTWVVERDGEWVCFQSCWFANGVKF